MKKVKGLKFCMMIFLMTISLLADAQKKIVAYDFESPIDLKGWFVANSDIAMTQCTSKDCVQLPGSSGCLRIVWPHVPDNKANTWFSDIKIDTFGNKVMDNMWQSFKQNIWLSFKVNTADADSVYFQFIVFTKDERDKWGSHEVIGVKSAAWKTVKVKLSGFQYSNWGKGNIAVPDFTSIIPARIEIGVKSAHANNTGKIDVRLDDLILTNYEPK